MSTFCNERVFVLVPATDWSLLTQAEKDYIYDVSTCRGSENLLQVTHNATNKYLFESIRQIAVGSKLANYRFYTHAEIKTELSL